MTFLLITIAAFFSTLLGGLFALRLKDRLHLILGFSAGAIIGVAFFDLLPEALNLTRNVYSPDQVLFGTALGFALYLALDRLVLLHHHEEHGPQTSRGILGASSLSFHSFLDGMGIGLAFQVNTAVGIIVATAVLTHDFSDGINTVSMIVKSGGDRKHALRWLFLDALAPVLGVAATFFFSIPEAILGLFLSLFAGFFIYIGASDLIPESHHSHPMRWTTAMTLLGMATLFIVIRIASLY